MNENVYKYKGYQTHVEFSAEDRVLHGKIEGINDLIIFESDNAAEIEKEFHSAVDDYLTFCSSAGKEPQKAYSGSFNVRISPELHKKLEQKASERGITLNAAVGNAIAVWTAPSMYDMSIPAAINEETINIWKNSTFDESKYRIPINPYMRA